MRSTASCHRPAGLRRRLGTALLAAATTAAAFAAFPASPAAAASTEQFDKVNWTVSPTARGTTVTDAAATGGQSLKITDTVTIWGDFYNASSTGRLSIKSRGTSCVSGQPPASIQVTVDGVIAGNIEYTNTSYVTRTFWGPWSAGTHSLTLNVAKGTSTTSPLCNGEIWLDEIVASDGTGYLTRTGDEVFIDAQQYRYVGFNAFGMSGCENGGTAWTNTQLDAYFSKLSQMSTTRTWAHYWNSTADLDRILASARKYEQKVIFSIGDGRSGCEEDGVTPAGNGKGKTDAWYTSGFRTTYKPWAATLANRYKNEPALAFWELLNEPGFVTGTTLDDDDMKAFFDEMAGYIKGIDANHMITTGALAEFELGTTDYSYVHSGANIDIGSVHEYDYDFETSPGVYANTITSPWVTSALAEMQSINKPLIVGETGINSGTGCRTLIGTRGTAMGSKIDAYMGTGTTENGMLGVNVWSVTLQPWTCAGYGYPGEYAWVTMTDQFMWPQVTQNNTIASNKVL